MFDDESNDPQPMALLVLPRLRIQNANAISLPLTWGFPSITAFVGLGQALQRKLAGELALQFLSVGVVCHHFQAQTTRDRFSTHSFHLTRNPVDKDGDTAAIVEEGRMHLDLTLIFGVRGDVVARRDPEQWDAAAQRVGDVLAGMRVAGGSVLPPLPQQQRRSRPYLATLASDDDDGKAFARLRRRWLPGFALVSRDDLLHQHHDWLRQRQPDASRLQAWLDAARLNHHAERHPVIDPDSGQPEMDPATGEARSTVQWATRRMPGWVVPIPVGYGALHAQPHAPGTVASARDRRLPFHFVESLYSLGQWISPHRLQQATDLLWFSHADPASGLFRCLNRYRAAPELSLTDTLN